MTRSCRFDRNRTRVAKKAGRELANTHRLWFRNKYNLAPTDERYLRATDEAIETEYWAYQYQANKVQEEIVDDDFDLAAVTDGFAQIGEELAALKRRAALTKPAANKPATPVDDWEDINIG